MSRAASSYRKLPGRKSGIHVTSTLWIGRDHLLSVRNTRFAEEYRRFYFTDIQGVVLQKVRREFLWQAILLLPVLAAAATLLAVHVRWYWLGIPAAFAVAILIPWLAAGDSCVGHLQTAVSVEQLPSLCHWRSSQRALAEIRESVERVQGSADLSQLSSEESTFAARLRFETAPPALPFRDRFHVHLAGFALLLITGILGTWEAFQPGVASTGALLTGHTLAFCAMIASLILHDRRSVGRRLAVLVGAATAFLVVAVSLSGWLVIVRWQLSTLQPAAQNAFRNFGSPVLSAIGGVLGLILGLAGVIVVWMTMPSQPEPPLTLFPSYPAFPSTAEAPEEPKSEEPRAAG